MVHDSKVSLQWKESEVSTASQSHVQWTCCLGRQFCLEVEFARRRIVTTLCSSTTIDMKHGTASLESTKRDLQWLGSNTRLAGIARSACRRDLTVWDETQHISPSPHEFCMDTLWHTRSILSRLVVQVQGHLTQWKYFDSA